MGNVEIMLCSDHSLDTIGGAQLSSNIILNGLKESDYNLGVIQPGKNSSKLENVEYFEIGDFKSIKTVARHPFNFINYIKQVKNILNKEKPDLIITTGAAVAITFFYFGQIQMPFCKTHINLTVHRIKMFSTCKWLKIFVVSQ